MLCPMGEQKVGDSPCNLFAVPSSSDESAMPIAWRVKVLKHDSADIPILVLYPVVHRVPGVSVLG
eukprot:15448670-Alexandrium_andersonii.AAC.1